MYNAPHRSVSSWRLRVGCWIFGRKGWKSCFRWVRVLERKDGFSCDGKGSDNCAMEVSQS